MIINRAQRNSQASNETYVVLANKCFFFSDVFSLFAVLSWESEWHSATGFCDVLLASLLLTSHMHFKSCSIKFSGGKDKFSG